MEVGRSFINIHDLVMADMMETQMGSDKKERRMMVQEQKDKIEQMWLQWGLENQLKVSQDDTTDHDEDENNIPTDKVEVVRQKMAAL